MCSPGALWQFNDACGCFTLSVSGDIIGEKHFGKESMQQTILIAAAGALGALGRWFISRAAYSLLGAGFPWGTLVANLIGCFLLGFIMQAGVGSDRMSPQVRTAITVGFLGALTTFSTFSYETLRCIEKAAWVTATVNVLTNLFLGLLAAGLGIAAAKLMTGGQGQ